MTDVGGDDVAEAMVAHPSPVVTAGDLAEELGCTPRHALNVLRGLEAAGVVGSRTVGAKAVAWWHVDRVRPPPTDADEAADTPERERRPDPAAVEEGGSDDGRDEQDDDGGLEGIPPDRREDVEEAVARAAAAWGDEGDRLEARKEAARAVLLALAARGEGLSKSEIQEEFAGRYPVEGQSADTWWRRNLAESSPAPLRLVAEYSRGTGEWRWTGLDAGESDEE